ncbi:multicopper oxidase family protein [Pseudomonas sp. ACM7]|uniref:multicopper oxidase family protein n=1 Tax=Pseudomonas sp. ACM7 TaxID=2052956 RepID=UPI0010101955|nr:multicopper oxidase family protein [Pseudomonas sp. ACM7]QAY93166.1 copper oxidase [Pseudomonas sp. ACM7]
MQRRTFLGGVAVAGLAAPWLQAWSAVDMASAPVGLPLLASDLLPAGATLRELPKLANSSSTPGHFQATLTAAPLTLPLIPGHASTEFWAYNDSLPGPLIELFEGDMVEITFINNLKQPSTIHWHGLPIPPEQDGNPHDPVPPGGRHTYRFNLPQGSAGTYWYHPHPHQYTAEQAYRGLAGPLLVRSRKDPLAELPERLLVVSDLKLDRYAAIAPNDSNDWMNGREGQFALVNAQRQPVLPFDAGGRERWRVWNACSARYLQLTLPGSTLTLVGTDGGLLEAPQPVQAEYLLAPAQRIELIVDAGSLRDRIELNANIYSRGKMGDVEPDKVMSLLTVDFTAVRTTALAALPGRLGSVADLGPVVAHKQVVFSEKMNMANGTHRMQFLINDQEYDMGRVDLVSKINEVELWELVNRSDMDHPFHLHGTQFQVVERELGGVITPAPFRAWQDTVNLRSNEIVRIKTVQRWSGLRMFHCHILEHEATGMMGQLKVV